MVMMGLLLAGRSGRIRVDSGRDCEWLRCDRHSQEIRNTGWEVNMKRNMVSGKIEEIIYARLEPGEDLLRALWDICKQNEVKTGVLLDCTGSMDKLRVMRFPHEARNAALGIDYTEIREDLEVSAHGMIGMGWVPDKSVTVPPPTQDSVLPASRDTRLPISMFILRRRVPRRRSVGTSWRGQRFTMWLTTGEVISPRTFPSPSQKFLGSS
ncbi:PCC domain-containing protein [Bradyrhizobium hipponense]|uniref:PCC domain-containing protein n=1 Tax=Bradyrhizobium hipponense TaxID=2605638 RepID=UPI003D31C303